MTPEETAEFAIECGRYGKLVAEVDDDLMSIGSKHKTYREWRRFRKEKATTKELKQVADVNFKESYDARLAKLGEY